MSAFQIKVGIASEASLPVSLAIAGGTQIATRRFAAFVARRTRALAIVIYVAGFATRGLFWAFRVAVVHQVDHFGV